MTMHYGGTEIPFTSRKNQVPVDGALEFVCDYCGWALGFEPATIATSPLSVCQTYMLDWHQRNCAKAPYRLDSDPWDFDKKVMAARAAGYRRGWEACRTVCADVLGNTELRRVGHHDGSDYCTFEPGLLDKIAQLEPPAGSEG